MTLSGCFVEEVLELVEGYIGVAVALVAVAIGVAGTVLPGLPGLPLVWLAIFGYALATGFDPVGWGFVIGTLTITVVTEVAEHYVRALGARRFGAGRAGAWGAAIGAIVGLFFLPLGLLLGPFAGAAIAEILAGKDLAGAARAGIGGVVGTLGFIPVKLVIALALGVAFAVRAI